MNSHSEYLISNMHVVEDTSIRNPTARQDVSDSFSDDRSYQLTDNGQITSINNETVTVAISPWSQSPLTDEEADDEEARRTNELMNNSLTSSTLKVEISDLGGEESFNLTTSALRKCKIQVLRPYWRLLTFIGWRGFGTEMVNSGRRSWRVLNIVYPSIIVLLLIYTYIYEMVACQWKLNVQVDTHIKTTVTTMHPTTPNITNFTTTSFPFSIIKPAKLLALNVSTADFDSAACEHLITTYIVPNFLHFVAYIMGIFYFRIQENEQLYALMEKVFLQATPQQNRNASQQKMIWKLRGFLICGAVWVISTMVLQGVYIWAFNFPQLEIFQKVGQGGYWTMFVIELYGRMILNSVILAVVVNYITQCEMILFFVRGICLRLQEKSTEIRIAMKDILLLRLSLNALNGIISKMTSLTLVILAELSIIGISILALNKNVEIKVWAYRGIFPIVWALMLGFPLFQAARVNAICKRLKKIALEMRVFGYKNSSQIELDSFLNYIGHTVLKAKLFHIPVQPSYLIAILVLTAFVFLILFQTSSIGASNMIF